MRDHLVLYVNGTRHTVRGADAFLSLSDFLRLRLGLIGTKIVCSEGDCGACTTLIGRPSPRGRSDQFALDYRPLDSCIAFVFQLDGTHVVSVEGLRPAGGLNPVQQAMVDCHGSQCGFCTPGFVMAMTGALEQSPGSELDEPQWRRALTGNLCRCTGYTPILDAAMQACEADFQPLNELYPPQAMLADFAALASDPIEVTHEPTLPGSVLQRAACPATLDDALAYLAAHPEARIVAGATDVGVRANKSGRLPATILDLNRVAELDFIHVEDNAGDAAGGGQVVAGARASWSRLLSMFEQRVPEVARILSVFGAPQIRHAGTIGGNIANASPIADSLPFLFAMDATLVLATAAGRRTCAINDFYRGYKQFDLAPGELIAEVHIPLPPPGALLRLAKVSRRRDLDISTFTSAICLTMEGDTIAEARIALGGVGPVVLRARETERYLHGKPLTEATMEAAGDLAASEITPITDVRGAAAYRRQLTRNIFLKFYHQTQADPSPTLLPT